MTISFEELEEAADGLEKVTISFEELEEAADGLEKVTVSFEEPEEAADGLEKWPFHLVNQKQLQVHQRTEKYTATYADACIFFMLGCFCLVCEASTL